VLLQLHPIKPSPVPYLEVRFDMKPKAAEVVTFILVLVTTALTIVNSAQAAGKFRVIHSFLDKPASIPSSALVADTAGNLYGVTKFDKTSMPGNCGEYGCGGAVFKLTHESGGKWNYRLSISSKVPTVPYLPGA